MYTGTDPDLIDLQNQITVLYARLNTLDGMNLPDPTTGVIPTLQRTVNADRTTMQQSVLKMQQLYYDVLNAVNSYIALFKSKFGLS